MEFPLLCAAGYHITTKRSIEVIEEFDAFPFMAIEFHGLIAIF